MEKQGRRRKGRWQNRNAVSDVRCQRLEGKNKTKLNSYLELNIYFFETSNYTNQLTNI